MVATAGAWVLCRETLGGAFARWSVSSCGEAGEHSLFPEVGVRELKVTSGVALVKLLKVAVPPLVEV